MYKIFIPFININNFHHYIHILHTDKKNWQNIRQNAIVIKSIWNAIIGTFWSRIQLNMMLSLTEAKTTQGHCHFDFLWRNFVQKQSMLTLLPYYNRSKWNVWTIIECYCCMPEHWRGIAIMNLDWQPATKFKTSSGNEKWNWKMEMFTARLYSLCSLYSCSFT